MTLMRAVDSFDFHRGHKFSTYATLALMKGFARSVPQMLSSKALATPAGAEQPARIKSELVSARARFITDGSSRTPLNVLNELSAGDKVRFAHFVVPFARICANHTQ